MFQDDELLSRSVAKIVLPVCWLNTSTLMTIFSRSLRALPSFPSYGNFTRKVGMTSKLAYCAGMLHGSHRVAKGKELPRTSVKLCCNNYCFTMYALTGIITACVDLVVYG